MDRVLIRKATASDALLVAALTIQAARAEGLSPATGFMDTFAREWLENRDQHPAWWAEADGQHVGLLLAERTRHLPWPGRATTGRLACERLFVRPNWTHLGIADSLRAAAREWGAGRRVEWGQRGAPGEQG